MGLVLSVAMAGACSSKAVDVGGPEAIEPSPLSSYSTGEDVPPVGDHRPWKLAEGFYTLMGVTVDSDSVFFAGERYVGEKSRPLAPLSLVECAPEDCAGTRKSLPLPTTSSSFRSISISVNQTGIFWPNSPPPSDIYSVDRSDWSTPAPLTSGEGADEFAVDATRAFFTDRGALLRCSLSDCAGTVMRYPMRPPPGEEVFTRDANMVIDDAFIYLSDGERIVRVAKEGSDTFEVLARDLRSVGQLMVREESIFWTESVVLGRVYSCPKTGCDGTPRILVDRLATPRTLAVDGQYLYFTEAPKTSAGGAEIFRCPIAGCESPELVVGEDAGAAGPLAEDDQFLYFLGEACTPPGESQPDTLEHCAYLAAIRK